MELPEIRPEERTPLVESLLAIIQKLLDRNQQLEETVLQLRDEIAILNSFSTVIIRFRRLTVDFPRVFEGQGAQLKNIVPRRGRLIPIKP